MSTPWRIGRRWSLRTTFVVLTVLCIVLGIVCPWVSSALAQRSAVASLRSSHCIVGYSYQFDSDGKFDDEAPTVPPGKWAKSWGPDFFYKVEHVQWVSDSHAHTDGEENWLTISRFRSLRSLELYGSNGDVVTPMQLNLLTRLQKLETLRILNRAIDDDALTALARLPKLKRLECNGIVTGKSFAALRACPDLAILNIRCLGYKQEQNQLTRQALQDLSALPSLRSLTLEGVQLTGNDAEALTVIKQLTSLNLAEAHDADKLLAALPASTTLTKLNLERADLTDASLCHLAKFPNLEVLNLQGTQVTDLDSLAQSNPKLRTLNLSWTPTRGADLSKLAGYPVLETLRIAHCDNIVGPDLLKLV